jgi:uncharacterized protein
MAMKNLRTFFPLIVNGLACAAIGAAFGSFGGIIPWIIGGFCIGVVVAAGWEAFFRPLEHHHRLFRFRPVLLLFVEFLLTIYLVLPIFAGWNNAHPKRVAIPITPLEMGISYQDVQLITSDGIKLVGWYIPSQNGAAIIALHGFNGNRTHVLPHTKILQQAGYGVLLFDLRAMGESEGEVYHMGWNGDLDVAPAVEFLKSRPEVDTNRIGILGLSSGGMAALNAAAEIPELRSVIADGVEANRVEDLFNPMPPPYRKIWFMTPMPWMTDRFTILFTGISHPASMNELLSKISPRKVLFIASGAEAEIFQGRKYAAANPGNVAVWEIPEAKHTGGIFVRPEEYAQKIVDFFDNTLK